MLLLESLPTVVGTAAIAPALLILWLVVAAGERPGPPTKVWTAFFLGAASISLLGLIRTPFMALLTAPENQWLAQGLHSLFGVALPEEAVKILVIATVSAWRRPFTDPMDTVIYGAAAGLGFAAYENLAYLVQHVDMWQSLAALRSVLTVPFHGALGIIAGAYLAIARSGTALGAHRHHRDWARITSWILVLAGPVGLHAAFDFPLLTLQRNPDIDGTTRLLLGSASILIGFSSIAFAARLIRRVGRHHAPRTDVARERLSQLRRMWALLVVGGGTGFVGLAFVLSSVHRWLLNPDRNMTLFLVPIGLLSILVGLALLVVTTAVYFLGRDRLRTNAP
ncbi:PrsW family glutamic-type intramembrane protease [Bradyrhizobium sp.]|jgi:RsiW-degrading membrane proteinase PrsW (M82 family)|uniref:PrsW family glutamic-type intramembrane protease n=1 Tax=Bradyrhizobium sp. TaxID=376 RepID=UPI003BB0E215